MKKLIPFKLRLYLKIGLRYLVDIKTGQLAEFVSNKRMIESKKSRFIPQITISQLLKISPRSVNKKHNLSLAIKGIENVIIEPGKIFSFWHLVGNPNAQKGYLEGRSIVADQIKEEYGGGLCQLSGLIHFLALKAGLNMLERYPHSQDLYTEETRFAPLGSDATVVYGYKDLRFRNTLSVPICLRFIIDDDQVTGTLCSPDSVTELTVNFPQKLSENGSFVETIRYIDNKSEVELLYATFYKKYGVSSHYVVQ
jgi:vancomycin resistance protein VanW